MSEPAGHVSESKQRRTGIAAWICRVCFTIVFVLNIQCAFSYVLFPGDYTSGFQLSGLEGAVAIQGIGVAFLMWNATYPAFIVNPSRFKVFGFVILAQQTIGLLGESAIFFSLPATAPTIASSILRFITFDAVGLILMASSFAALLIASRR